MAILRIKEIDGPPAEVEVVDDAVRMYISSIAKSGFYGKLVNGDEVYIPVHRIARVEIDRTP